MRIGKHLFVIKLPLFRKEGVGGDLTTATYLKLPLYKRVFFMTLVLMILLGIYLLELRTESIYLPLKSPLFRKEGAGGDSLLQLIQNQFPHHFNMGFFSIQCGDVVIRHTAVI